ncbi:MAG: IPTL-CTERM sorting domain-containing protein [Saprospiraceae bacterium]
MKTKQLLLILFALCSIFQSGITQCAMSHSFTTQASLSTVSSCTTITGSITVNGGNINDLSPFSNITSITGNLNILNTTMLTSLNGLDNLVSVAGIRIMTNNMLTDINALDKAIVSGSGSLIIQDNEKLSQCCAFSAQLLAGSIGSVTITNNNKTTSGCDNTPEVLADNSCAIIATPKVPTMGEWGLINLSLLMMIIGIVAIRHHKYIIIAKE